MKEKILHILKENDFVSGVELSKQLGISRTAVWKHIQSLKKQGYQIWSVTSRGYKLENVPDFLLPELIKESLHTESFGENIHHYDVLESTNEKAKDLADRGAEEGTVVISEKQAGGKGRLGRYWVSPEGGVWMSVVLRPQILPSMAQVITLVAAAAVCKSLQQYSSAACIKWPNDILIGNKKVCGILTELKAEMDGINYVILGIGLNANTDINNYPAEIRDNLTSLRAVSSQKIDRVSLVADILSNLEKEYNLFLNSGVEEIIANWKKYNITLHKHIDITSSTGVYSGRAVDIDEYGGLLVEDDKGHRKTFYSGEVTLQK